jgi:outer membrane protein assembly factor BamA
MGAASRLLLGGAVALLLAAPVRAGGSGLQSAPPPAQTQALEELYGRRIAAVRFEIEGRPVTDSAQTSLQALVDLREGEPLRAEAVRESIVHLVNAGRFDDVQVFGTDGPNGVDVRILLTPRHPVDRLQFTGDVGLTPAELEQLVRERFGGLPAREQPEMVARVVEGLLEDEGFPSARVAPRVEPTHNPDRATLILDVRAGPRVIIGHTEVAGTSLWSSEAILARTHTQAGQPFRRRALETELAAIGDDMRRQGYYTASSLLRRGPDLAAVGGTEPVNLTLYVEAGPRVSLRWDGPKPDGDEEDFVPMRRQRSADEDLLEDSDQRIATFWRQRGYRDVKVTHTSDRQGSQLVITVHTDVGLRYRIAELGLTGVAHLPETTVRENLQIGAGDPDDQFRLARGLQQVKLLYLRAGYFQVQTKELDPEELPGSRTAAEVRLVVHVDVAEGPVAAIGNVVFTGMRPDLEKMFRERMRSRPGTPYVLEYLRRDKIEIDQYYHDHAFEAEISQFDPVPGSAPGTMDVKITVSEGPQITVADIRVVGNKDVSEKHVREVLTLREGAPFGEAERLESQTALYNMGVFRRVSIDEEPRLPGETTTHVIVTLEELPATIFSIGGGLEVERRVRTREDGTIDDRLTFAPRGFFELGRRNLGGKNRSIDFFSRVALRPGDSPTQHFGFSEYRVSGTYFEPRAFQSDTNLTAGLSSEQGHRTDFNFVRRSVNGDAVRRLSPRVTVSGRYAVEFTRLFDSKIPEEDQPTIDRFFPQVRLSILSSGLLWDRRNDPVAPQRGTLVTVDWEVAPRRLGSQVGYTKLFLQGSGFRSLNANRRVVLAVRAELGAAHGFERTVLREDGTPQAVADLPASQRFFAGGSTTVRGFQLDRLGVPEIVNKDGLSLGGNAVVVLNAEIRTTVAKLKGRDFGVVGFTDGGNVFAHARDLDLARLRGTYGFGLRYDSPLGPVRLDFGIKMDRHVISGRRERGWEYHLNIGEAF